MRGVALPEKALRQMMGVVTFMILNVTGDSSLEEVAE